VTVISIRKSLSELDRVEQLYRIAARSYDLAIRSTAEYVVELDKGQADEFRNHLNSLRLSLEQAGHPDDFQAIQSSFRGELRDYRDNAQEWLLRMKDDLKSATEAMQVLANNVTSNANDYETKLRADLERLEAASHNQDLTLIRAAIRGACAGIAKDLEEMRRANQFAITQLYDEIRALHREMDKERKALYTDPVSGAWNRVKVETRLREMLRREECFCLIVIWITNLKREEGTTSQNVLHKGLKAMVKRIEAVVGQDAIVSRWSDEDFVVLTDLVSSAAVSMSQELLLQLSRPYSIQEDGRAQRLELRVSTAVVDRPTGCAPDVFRKKLEQVVGVMHPIS
jgi:GGDEF domain-containing protein